MAEEGTEETQADKEQSAQETDAPQATNKGGTTIDYDQIARSVAALLKPMIEETIQPSIQQGLTQLRKDMATQGKSISDMQQWIAAAEEIIQEGQTCTEALEKTIQYMAEKIYDLENGSWRNNLRILGLPETYKMADLQRLCTEAIPKALGIKYY